MLAVGGRVLITGAAGVADVPLSDDHGVPTGATVRADTEVEIVAWRPRGPNGARYRIRASADGTEGWVDAPSVRARPVPPAPPRVVLPAQPVPPPTRTARPTPRRSAR